MLVQYRLCLTGILFLCFISGAFSQSRAVISGNVSDQFGNLPGARVVIEGTDKNTTTDVNGNYSFDVDEGEYIVTSEFVMYTSVSKTILVKVGDTAKVDFILETGFSIDQPVSLGSRAKPKSILKNTAAVDIISPQQLTNSSQVELSHILHYLIPSFHSTHQTIADGTDHIDPATLRGLGPDQVLVLVNGKRRHNSSLLNVNGTVGRGSVGTDFNAIPIASIERIEILRDGATSQYGSDAIAGVINIILKKQTEIIQLDNRVAINTEGDGLNIYSSANFGLKIGKEGYINVTAEYRDRESINRSGDYTGTVYSNDSTTDQTLIEENNFFAQTGYSGKRVMEIGSAETQNLALSFNGEIIMSDYATFYMHGGRNYREGTSKGFYRFPKDENRVVLELFPNGFSPEILTDIQDDAITGGIRGIKNEWNVDFSHSIGVNRLDYTVNNSNNASLGVTSPRTFHAGGFIYKQNTTNLDISRTFDWLSGVNVAFGAELRVENYEIVAGEEASYVDGGSTYTNTSGVELPRIVGAQVFPGFQPENALNRFRTNSSGYLDIEANITDKLLIRGAARYEAYNDFGGQAIWKLSGRYRVRDEISIRAGFSTGFRAPSLHQVFFQNISTQFINGESVQVGTFNNESAVATEAFDIGNLKPELSSHFNTGFSGKLNDNITFSFDYYLINIQDRIVLSGRFAEGYEEILEPFNVGAAQFFTNAIDSRTTGADLSLFFKTTLGTGEFNASLGGNFTKTKVKGPINVSQALVGQEEVLFNREEIARVEFAQPNYKINSLLSYDFEEFGFQVVNTLFGKVKFIHPNDGNSLNWVVNDFTGNIESRDQVFSPKLVTDMAISYQVSDYIKCTLGGNNVFNVYPDKHKHAANTEDGNFMYSRRVQQFGLNGSNYYVRLLLKL
ncbi:iron complex outermembrane receptor protein [Aquimarina sp. EL_43]|uniref:TonB-dependent receptor n=1 Tax=unclassified Aquimarina TaxID=2627091 RepID=UPI001A341E3A|nr:MULTISPECIES: TonB-dependent receptor [unclassified Aquimarina]MBG6132270.1 iron complex outermembrane receptor protein [Aquimarina sp. EL_35]MBG6153754.1 iron complex outermembrane receptor protein [Aquimarina sp. EL_32]MBG6171910.1 iron complex outermembrane receptor protein [Aquimarina sp. EL_43]